MKMGQQKLLNEPDDTPNVLSSDLFPIRVHCPVADLGHRVQKGFLGPGNQSSPLQGIDHLLHVLVVNIETVQPCEALERIFQGGAGEHCCHILLVLIQCRFCCHDEVGKDFTCKGSFDMEQIATFVISLRCLENARHAR